MKRLLSVLGAMLVMGLVGVLLGAAPAVRAQTTIPLGCVLMSQTPQLPNGLGEAMIGCSGLNEATGNKLAEVLHRILQNRLDPQLVLTKLDELAPGAEEGVARTVSEDQRQRIIKSLLGKPAAQVAVTAHPLVEDSAGFAQALAMALVTVGWQIEGDQIRRRAPKELDPVTGVALVVRDRNAPSQKAQHLRAAFAAASIGTALVSDPALAPDAIMLWVGRRPDAVSTEPPK